MSYLFPQGTGSELGVLEVGANINVSANSVISIPQSVATNASVTFDSVNATGNLTLNGASVVANVTPTAGTGIAIGNLISSGPNASWTVTNTGVTSIVAGNNISISGNTGVVTISSSQSPLIQTTATANAYTALATDEYIGVTANPTTITLPTGVVGKTYIIKNENGGTTTVTGTGGQQLDGSNTKALNSNASLTVVFRGGQWRII